MGTNARTDGQIFTQCSGISSHSMGVRIMIDVFHINTDDKENGLFPQSDNSGMILSMQGDGEVILMIGSLHMTKQNTSCGSLTSMLGML
jgi:hypothetical protein